MLSVGKVVVFFSMFLQYMAKNMALLVQLFLRDFFGQNPFSAILRLKNKKNPMITKLKEGRGLGGFSGWTTKRIFFLRLP